MPAFTTFPPELLLEIIKYLGFRDMLAIEQTCRVLFNVVQDRAVWTTLFHHLSSALHVPPILERPLAAYTSGELKQLLIHRISAEASWAITKVPSQVKFRRGYPHEDDSIILLDGGRWLLATFYANDEWGRVYVYDLNNIDNSDPQVLIDLEITGHMAPGNSWFMAADRDLNDTSALSYYLCLTPCYTSRPDHRGYVVDWPVGGIHIYRLIVKGRGKEATLEAHKLKTLADISTANVEGSRLVYDITLRGDYLVRSLDLSNPGPDTERSYRFEVYNWAQSDSSIQLTAYITGVLTGPDSQVLLVPDGKLVVFTTTGTLFFDITDLEPICVDDMYPQGLQPYWHLPDSTYSVQNYFSKSYQYSDPDASIVTVVLDSGIFGLIIPDDIHQHPFYQRLSNYRIPKGMIFCLGISKAYYAISRGLVMTMGLMWQKDDGYNYKPRLLHPRQFQAPLYPWDSKIPPLFDESSNRIVAFANHSWMLLDFGHTCHG